MAKAMGVAGSSAGGRDEWDEWRLTVGIGMGRGFRTGLLTVGPINGVNVAPRQLAMSASQNCSNRSKTTQNEPKPVLGGDLSGFVDLSV